MNIETILLLLIALVAAGAAIYMTLKRAQIQQELYAARLENATLTEKTRLLEDNLKAQGHSKEALAESFKGLADSALKDSMAHFVNQAKATFAQAQEIQKLDSEQRHRQIDDLVKPMTDALLKYQTQAEKLELERQRAFTQIDGELKRVVDAQTGLTKETTALKDALKRPHVRGRWGEVQLKNCIELAGMSEYSDVTFQTSTSDAEGARHQPDMMVRMPGGRTVIVDAKTPIDAFLNSLEAPTEELRRTEMVRHGKHVKEQVKKLSQRAYADVLKDTADFTVLFLPNESFLYAALESEPDIVEFALQKKVLIATPPTLIGLLKVIRFGWSEQRLAENARQISEAGQELHKRLCDFVDAYVGIGKHLDKAKEEFEKGRSRLESRVLVQARRFESLGAKSSKSLLAGGGGDPLLEAPEV